MSRPPATLLPTVVGDVSIVLYPFDAAMSASRQIVRGSPFALLLPARLGTSTRLLQTEKTGVGSHVQEVRE